MVSIDAHIMCSPTIADLDGDGSDELIVPVSYFFDRAYYDSAENRHELPRDLDLAKYVASGVVVFDLRAHTVKWSQHLDLTTDQILYRHEVSLFVALLVCTTNHGVFVFEWKRTFHADSSLFGEISILGGIAGCTEWVEPGVLIGRVVLCDSCIGQHRR
jgi:hypothetical protein